MTTELDTCRPIAGELSFTFSNEASELTISMDSATTFTDYHGVTIVQLNDPVMTCVQDIILCVTAGIFLVSLLPFR